MFERRKSRPPLSNEDQDALLEAVFSSFKKARSTPPSPPIPTPTYNLPKDVVDALDNSLSLAATFFLLAEAYGFSREESMRLYLNMTGTNDS